MASTSESDKFGSNNKVTMYDHDPGDTAANDVGWVDMNGYGGFVAIIFCSALGGNGATAFTINANSSSTGAGTDAEVKSHAVSSAPDAVGDWLILECTAEEIRSVETAATGQLRYVTAIITNHHNDDEEVVTYIRTDPRFAKDGLTVDTVA